MAPVSVYEDILAIQAKIGKVNQFLLAVTKGFTFNRAAVFERVVHHHLIIHKLNLPWILFILYVKYNSQDLAY
jgi:hypothetical protein